MKQGKKSGEKTELGVSTALSRLLMLPESSLNGGLRIELNANREALVEGCTGVMEYTPERIRLAANGMVLRFSGRELCIGGLGHRTTIVTGAITALEFLF